MARRRSRVRAGIRRRLRDAVRGARRRSACLCRRAWIWSRAAAIPETFFTVWTNVFDRGRLRAGETALFHGGSSGIGTTAIQLAAARGARGALPPPASDEKCRACEALGAERAINYRTQDFVDVVEQLTGGRGVDLILDIVGGDYIARDLAALADRRAARADRLDGRRHRDHRLPTRARAAADDHRFDAASATVAEKGEIATALRREVWPLLEAGARQAGRLQDVPAAMRRPRRTV